MLLIDDGSTDGSRALAETLAAEDARIRPLALPENRGPAAARNAGIRAARGRFIAFLDADDRWRPEKLERQLDFMAQGRPCLHLRLLSAHGRSRPAGRGGGGAGAGD